jgi:hypothetical protein
MMDTSSDDDAASHTRKERAMTPALRRPKDNMPSPLSAEKSRPTVSSEQHPSNGPTSSVIQRCSALWLTLTC